MRSPRVNRLAWVGIAIAVVGLAASRWVKGSDARVHCLSVPCSYVENHQRFRGTCGSREADPKNCYCFKQDAEAPAGARANERWPSHIQAACER
jgi:hypothetical protein